MDYTMIATQIKSRTMKYMLLMIYQKFWWFANWRREDLQANAFMRKFNKELADAGTWFLLLVLAGQTGVIVHASKDGRPITDGVFPESKGFLLVIGS